MHRALADAKGAADFAPEAFSTLYQRGLYQSMRNLTGNVFEMMQRAALSSDDPSLARVLGMRDELLARFRGLIGGKLSAKRARIHGDFHLGQVLLHEEDAFFVDFEGEPTRSIDERRRVQSPLKDVAGMVRSFCYAAGAGLAVQPGVSGAELERLRLWARWWQTWSIASFLGAYCTTAAGARFFPSDPIVLDRVLRVFLIEKTLYETLYELAHRPSWLGIPLSGLLDLIGHTPATTHPPQAADDGLEG
jgi:maltose alpha-D-glucosyltransferase/alpha-amylase